MSETANLQANSRQGREQYVALLQFSTKAVSQPRWLKQMRD